MKEREAKEGVRVKYTDGYYGDSESNPKWGAGGEYIAGTISSAHGDHIEVAWDNGRTNDYYIDHLELLNADDERHHPGRCEDIW